MQATRLQRADLEETDRREMTARTYGAVGGADSREDDLGHEADGRRLGRVVRSAGDLERVDPVLEDGLIEFRGENRGRRFSLEGEGRRDSRGKEWTDVAGSDDGAVPGLEVHVISVLSEGERQDEDAVRAMTDHATASTVDVSDQGKRNKQAEMVSSP